MAPIIEQLAIGQWLVIPDTRMDAVAPVDRPDIQAVEGIPAVMNSWSGGIFDSYRNRLVVWGGGHNAYAGNEIYAFSLETLTWERLTDPSPIAGYDNNSPAYPDGNPSSKHTYGNLVYLPPPIDALWNQGGSKYPRGGDDLATWMFYFAENRWERRANAPASKFDCYSAYDSETGLVWHHPNLPFLSYDPTANTWKNYGNQMKPLWNYRAAAIDPKRRKYVVIGSGDVYIYDLDASRPTQQKVTTTGATEILSRVSPGFVYDPDLDRLVAWGNGPSLYSLNLDSLTWERHDSLDGSQPTAPNKNGTFGRFQYSPQSRCYVLVNRTNENVRLFRLSAPPGEEEEEPIVLPGVPENAPKLGVTNIRTGKLYGSLKAALDEAIDDDTLEVMPGRYPRQMALIQQHNLTIRCSGPGSAQFDAEGGSAKDKGVLVQLGNNLTLEGIDLMGAKSSAKNGAGLRIEGAGTTARRCRFIRNENGIFGGHSNGDILLEDCELAWNGAGDGFSHNIYVLSRSLTMRYTSSHHARVGHNVKSKCERTVLDHPMIYDGPDGTASGCVDIPFGGDVEITKGYIQKGPEASNNHWFKYGHEAHTRKYSGRSILINDTIILDECTGKLMQDIRLGAVVEGNNIVNGQIRTWPGATGSTPEPTQPEPTQPEPTQSEEEPTIVEPSSEIILAFVYAARELADELERIWISSQTE